VTEWVYKSQQSHLDEVLLTLLPQGMNTLLVRSSGSSACISFSGARLSCRPRTPLVGHFARLAVTQKGLQTFANTKAYFTMSVANVLIHDVTSCFGVSSKNDLLQHLQLHQNNLTFDDVFCKFMHYRFLDEKSKGNVAKYK
jgi:hypothetical protein